MRYLQRLLIIFILLSFVACSERNLPSSINQAPLEPSIDFFKATVTSLTLGDSVTLSWKVSALENRSDELVCSLREAPESAPAATRGVACEAEESFSPDTTSSYTLLIFSKENELLLSQTLEVSVEQSSFNQTPFVKNDEYDVIRGGRLDIDATQGVLANDSDSDGDTLTASLITPPLFGTVILNSDGSFSYQHDSSSADLDSFTYTASDGKANSTTVTAFINILEPPNTPPEATTDSYSVKQAESLSVRASEGVLSNDTDADNDPLTSILKTGVQHGEVRLDPDGSFTYSHNGNNAAEDSFSYAASDGKTESNIVTVTLRIIPNIAPTARDDNFTLEQASVLDVSRSSGLLANDSDPEDDSLSARLLNPPTHGKLSLKEDGSFRYEHDGGSSTRDEFSYFVTDGKNDSNAATVSLSITAIIKEFRIPISSSSDDTEERDPRSSDAGLMTPESVDLDLGRDAFGDKIVGLRFTNIPLTADSDIENAYIQFTTNRTEGSSGSPRIDVYLVEDPNPPTFSTSRNALTRLDIKRISTWRPLAWRTAGEQGSRQRLDVKDALEEALDQEGWKAGNAIAFLLDNNRSSGVRIADSFDGNPATAPYLVIELED